MPIGDYKRNPRGPYRPRPAIYVIGPSIAYIQLTQGKFTVVNEERADHLSKWNWCAHWSPLSQTFYAIRGIGEGRKGTVYMAVYILNPRKGMRADHKSGEGLNNLDMNLREATPTQNKINGRIRSDNKTGFRGVYKRQERGTYRTSIFVQGKRINLGEYTTPEMASEVYEAAALKHFGEFHRKRSA